MLCQKCYNHMVEVIITKISEKQYRLIVCVECGRTIKKKR